MYKIVSGVICALHLCPWTFQSIPLMALGTHFTDGKLRHQDTVVPVVTCAVVVRNCPFLPSPGGGGREGREGLEGQVCVVSSPVPGGRKVLRDGPVGKWATSQELLKVWKGQNLWERQRLHCQVGRWVEERPVLLVRKPDLEAYSETSL